MKTHSISVNSYVTPRTTGYAATTALGISIVSGLVKNKSLRKIHKPLAYAATAFTAIHVGLIEYYNHKFKKM